MKSEIIKCKNLLVDAEKILDEVLDQESQAGLVAQQTCRETPKVVKSRCFAWRFFMATWYGAYYILGILPIACSLGVAYLALYVNSAMLMAGLSFVSATCVSLNYFLLPYKNARGYVQAWRLLSSAIIKFEIDETIPVSTLIEAIDKGEELLSRRI